MRFVPIILLMLLCGGVYFAVRFVQQSSPSVAVYAGNGVSLPPNVNLRLSRLSLVGRKAGQMVWKTQADTLDASRDRSQISVSGHITATLLQDGKARAHLLAPAAQYSATLKLLTASGPAICTVPGKTASPSDTLTIQAEGVTWSVGERRIFCPGKVKATRGEILVTGREASVDLKTRRLTLRNFHADLPVEDTGLPDFPGR